MTTGLESLRCGEHVVMTEPPPATNRSGLDVLSNGRLMFGYGVGWLEPEFNAVGVPFGDRGPRADEYMQAMIALWTQDAPAFSGSFTSFSGVQSRPQPLMLLPRPGEALVRWVEEGAAEPGIG